MRRPARPRGPPRRRARAPCAAGARASPGSLGGAETQTRAGAGARDRSWPVLTTAARHRVWNPCRAGVETGPMLRRCTTLEVLLALATLALATPARATDCHPSNGLSTCIDG